MKSIFEHPLALTEAALWWLGQAGYVVRASGMTVALDPYLTDSAAANAPEFTRLHPPPIIPEELRVDVYVITHDHADHLDPETIRRYPAKSDTWFVAPRLAARRLHELGVPEERIVRLDVGETRAVGAVEASGVFALPTGADVLDTTGYLLRFANGRSVYHTSDTAFHPLVLAAAPREPDVMLVPINGKWGNLAPEQAVELAAAVRPRFLFPNHYDLMALNSENPETFRWFCKQRGLGARCVIAGRLEPFVWSQPS
jgi:L-ascorbate 6-phosphate lactonase